MVRKNKKIKKIEIVYFLGILIIFLGASITIYNTYKQSKQEKLEQVNVKYFFKDKVNKNKVVSIEKENDYIAIIEIPSINLKKGLVNPYLNENNVNYNIEILKPIHMPDEENENLILAAHSGTSEVSYFKDLYLLNKGSLIYIYYNNYKYIYKIIKKYETNKTGSIYVENEKNDTLLTLTTCSYNEKKQLIIISQKIKQEKY